MPLPYRAALVTGASSGIGRAIAAALRGAGMDVLAVGRDAEALASLAAQFGATPVVGDVRDRAAMAALVSAHEIDVLVANAGVLARGPFQNADLDALDEMIAVNLAAPLVLARLALPGMIARGRGHLVFIGSSAGSTPHPDLAAYGATKAAIRHFCDSLRGDLLGTGVRVTEIVPGRTRSKLYREAIGLDRLDAELYDGVDPIEPEDIAALTLTVLSAPPHLDVSRIEVYPASQAIAGTKVLRPSEPQNQSTIPSARLSEMLDEAKALHSATEAAQLSDISWLESELDDLRLPPDQNAAWRTRIELLQTKVYLRLGALESVAQNPPATAEDSQIADFGRRLRECERRLDELWGEIETEELRFVLAHPDVLLGRSEPHPPHLKQLAKNIKEAADLFRRLSAEAVPSGLLDMPAALVELAGRSGSGPDRAEDAARAAELAVALFRDTARAEPQASRQKLGAALVVLAQRRLAAADLEGATAAAVAAAELVGPDEMPPEVLGLTDSAA
jgi:3-hydroxy acid dehydrogenase/malonic semialdehyde reductase